EFVVAEDDHQYEVRLNEAAQDANEEIGRYAVGELGEEDDHRPPCEPSAERGQCIGVVGLVRAIVDLGRDELDLGEGAPAGDEATRQARAGIERVDGNAVAELERDPRREKHRRNAAIDSREAGDRLAHLAPAIDGEDDLVVALGLILLGDELQVARGLLPVDRAAVHAGAEVDEGVKVGPLAARQLGDQSFERMALEDARALIVDGAKVREHRKGCVNRDVRLVPGEAERSGPAQPQPLEPGEAATGHVDGQQDCAASALQRYARAAFVFQGDKRRSLQRDPRVARAAAHRDGYRAVAGLADIGVPRKGDDSGPASERADRIERRQKYDRERPREREIPSPGRSRGESEREGRARRRSDNRRPGRVDQRGASIVSMIAVTISSTLRPLISAAGERITRWRRSAGARAFTSSGMTKSRPSRAARARAAPASIDPARGLAPVSRSAFSRVPRTSPAI